MKTKEEILKEKGITELTAFHAYPYLYRATIEAMDLYAQQQTEELRKERPFQFSPTNSEREWQVKIVNDYIHTNQEDWQKMNAVCNSLKENAELRKENEELKVPHYQMAFKRVEELKQEITRLKELLERVKDELKWAIPKLDESPLDIDLTKQLLADIEKLNPKP